MGDVIHIDDIGTVRFDEAIEMKKAAFQFAEVSILLIDRTIGHMVMEGTADDLAEFQMADD